MPHATRTDIAKLLRTMRGFIRDYDDRARRSEGVQRTINRGMARSYRDTLAGARDMLETIRGR